MSFTSCVEIYEKCFYVQLNNFHSAAMAFNLFLEWKPTGKFQSLIPVAGGAPVRTVAQNKYMLLPIVDFL